ncbi:hypothetical protein KQX54_009308 [Cotesia glomerata]|uniref:Uncharacterized protein n=1 Tax=Cotesia glomerata TaxID=32391 RepID=A0AAV7IFS4_COTGL|nr:hypothetical protein KQX54_009308 [Cotesia glomerata]
MYAYLVIHTCIQILLPSSLKSSVDRGCLEFTLKPHRTNKLPRTMLKINYIPFKSIDFNLKLTEFSDSLEDLFDYDMTNIFLEHEPQNEIPSGNCLLMIGVAALRDNVAMGGH